MKFALSIVTTLIMIQSVSSQSMLRDVEFEGPFWRRTSYSDIVSSRFRIIKDSTGTLSLLLLNHRSLRSWMTIKISDLPYIIDKLPGMIALSQKDLENTFYLESSTDLLSPEVNEVYINSYRSNEDVSNETLSLENEGTLNLKSYRLEQYISGKVFNKPARTLLRYKKYKGKITWLLFSSDGSRCLELKDPYGAIKFFKEILEAHSRVPIDEIRLEHPKSD